SLIRWREAPPHDPFAYAALGLGGARSRPGAARDLHAGHLARPSERHSHPYGTGELWIHFQAEFLVAELELRLPAAHVVSELGYAAPRTTGLLCTDHARGGDSYGGEAHVAAAAHATETATTRRVVESGAQSAASGSARALAALAVADHGLSTAC